MRLLLTGHDNGAVRDAMARAVGADVVRWMNGRRPVRLPQLTPHDLVILDTRFLSHKQERVVRDGIAATGAQLRRIAAGSGGLARLARILAEAGR